MTIDNKSEKKSVREYLANMLRNRAKQVNKAFNALSLKAQRIILLTAGLCIAAVCVLAITEGFSPRKVNTIPIDSLTRPLMHPNEKKRDSTELIPLGKMKGEINGEFEAVYVAMDGKGNFFMNHNPTYAKDRWLKSDDWKQLSYQEFMRYEKELHFLPIDGKSKSLKR